MLGRSAVEGSATGSVGEEIHLTLSDQLGACSAGEIEMTAACPACRLAPGQRSRLGVERGVSSSSSAAAAQPAAAPEPDPCADPASTQHRSISVLNRYRALLLDSTYRPVGVANWQR